LPAGATGLAQRLDELEARMEYHQEETGQQIQTLFDALRQLLAKPEPPRREPIGFGTSAED